MRWLWIFLAVGCNERPACEDVCDALEGFDLRPPHCVAGCLDGEARGHTAAGLARCLEDADAADAALHCLRESERHAGEG